MKITMLQTAHVPGHPEFVEGTTRTVAEDLGQALIERGQAAEVKPEPKKSADKPAANK